MTGCLVCCPNRSIYCLHQITTDDVTVSTSHQNAIGNMQATYGSTYGSYKGEPNPTQVISTWVGLSCILTSERHLGLRLLQLSHEQDGEVDRSELIIEVFL